MAAITFDTTHAVAGRLEAKLPAALDAGIVSDAIPAFFIGRNKDGFWVARNAKARIGGIFLLEASAVSFARAQAGPGGCATIFPIEKFELDLENNVNPLIGFVRLLMRLALHLQRRTHALIGQIMQRSNAERGFLIMTLLTHTGGPFDRFPVHRQSESRPMLRTRTSQRSSMLVCSRFFLLALSTVGGAIALRTAIFLSRLSY